MALFAQAQTRTRDLNQWFSTTDDWWETYKGFKLTGIFRNCRGSSRKQWLAMKADWKNEVDSLLVEYDAKNHSEYKKNYDKKVKEEKETEKQERKAKEHVAEENSKNGKDKDGNDTFTSLQKQIEDLKANNIKSLERKEQDFKEILEKARKKHEEEMNEINKQIDIKNDEVTKLGEQYQKKLKENDQAAANRIMAVIRKKQEDLVALNQRKKDLPQPDDFKTYLEEHGSFKPLFNPKNKIFWKYLGIGSVFLIIIIFIIIFIIRKLISIFSSK